MLKRNLMAFICLGFMTSLFAAYPQSNGPTNPQNGRSSTQYSQSGTSSSSYQNGTPTSPYYQYQNGQNAAPQNQVPPQPAVAPPSPERISWFTNYNQAVIEAKRTNKPLLLFFTGSDWCGWCKKMVNEVFNSPDFAREVGSAFIFVEVDFPMNKPLPQPQQQQNNLLKQKYAVTGYPTIIILDPNENFIAETGYRPGGGKAYADYLRQYLS